MQKAFQSKFKKSAAKGTDGPSAAIERREEAAKPAFQENRSLAARVAAVVCVFVLLIMGPLKLKALRTEARNVFRNGTSTRYVVSVYNDIRSSADNAVTLAGLAETALGAPTEDTKTLRALAETIRKSEDEAVLLSSFGELNAITEDVFTRLENAHPSKTVLDQAQNCYKSIKSAFTTIGNDPYVSYARSFNEARRQFPASLMALIGGIHELPTGV